MRPNTVNLGEAKKYEIAGCPQIYLQRVKTCPDKPQFPADFLKFTTEILKRKLHFLCSVVSCWPFQHCNFGTYHP